MSDSDSRPAVAPGTMPEQCGSLYQAAPGGKQHRCYQPRGHAGDHTCGYTDASPNPCRVVWPQSPAPAAPAERDGGTVTTTAHVDVEIVNLERTARVCMKCGQPFTAERPEVLVGDEAAGYWKPRYSAHRECITPTVVDVTKDVPTPPVPSLDSGGDTVGYSNEALSQEQEVHSLLWRGLTYARDLLGIFERDANSLQGEERRTNRLAADAIREDVSRFEKAIPLALAGLIRREEAALLAAPASPGGVEQVQQWLDAHGYASISQDSVTLFDYDGEPGLTFERDSLAEAHQLAQRCCAEVPGPDDIGADESTAALNGWLRENDPGNPVLLDEEATARAEAEVAASPGGQPAPVRMFPIQRGPDIPWSAIAPFAARAKQNHGQTLERLAERGGLGVKEALAVLRCVSLLDRHSAEASAIWALSEKESILALLAETSPAPSPAPSVERQALSRIVDAYDSGSVRELADAIETGRKTLISRPLAEEGRS